MEFKTIPLNESFTISTTGVVKDAAGEVRTTYTNGDGYTTVSIYIPEKGWVTFGVHRLVALTFVDTDRDKTGLEVNHRDGDLTHNEAANLEWVTPKQNNIHSEIFRVSNQYPSLIGYFLGKPQSLFLNVHDAKSKTGIEVLDVWDSVKDSRAVNGWQFFHRGYAEGIPSELRKRSHGAITTAAGGRAARRSVKMRDIFTLEITVYESMGQAALIHDTTASHIYQSIQRGNVPRVFKKKYQVAYVEDEFIALTEEEIEDAKHHGPRAVIARQDGADRNVIFESAKQFIEMMGLKKKPVTTVLAANSFRKVDGWIFTYLTEENAKIFTSLVGSPVPS
jgi:hypothetical protein